MKKAFLTIAAGIPLLVTAASLDTVQGKAQLVVAVQDNSGVSFGTDAGTTSYPKAGMDTMPTKDVGTETNAVDPNAPASKPGLAPLLSPPPAFAPAPAYTPPANQSGPTNIIPKP